jgi:hypothetical protein
MTFIDIETISDTYRKWIREKVTSGNRRPGLHVSDLVSNCLRKPWYRMNKPSNGKISEISIPNFYYGTVIHESFDGMFPVMEYKMCVNPFDKLIEDDVINFEKDLEDYPFKWVSGSLDAIANNDTILDFKTCKKLPVKAGESYMKQINFYSYMYYLTTGTEIKKGAILYLEKESGFTNTKLFEFKLDDPETNRLYMCKIMSEIENENIPAKVISPLCLRS